MASQDLTLIIKAQNQTSAAFQQLNTGLGSVQKQVVSTTDKMGEFAAGVGRVSTTMARSAPAFGLPIGPLKALDDVADIAAIGLQGLTKATVGLNTATLGVIGAGLALGAAIGSWLNTFKAVTDAADRLSFSLYGVAKAAKVGAVEQKALNEAVIKQKDETLKKELELMKAQGKSWAEIKKFLADETKGRETANEMVDRQIDTEKKRAEAAKQWAVEAKQALVERLRLEKQLDDDLRKLEAQWTADDQQRMADELKDYADWKEAQLELEKQFSEDLLQNELDRLDAQKQAREDYWDEQERQYEAERVQLEEQAQLWANVGEAISVAGDAFVLFGADADSVLVKLADGLAGLANTASTVFSNLARGDVFGAVTSGLGGVINFIGGLFGGSDKAREEMEKLYAEFMRSVGGIENLQAAADEAGISLQALFDAKKAEELEAAIVDINRQLALWEDATDKTREAMERYGITIDQMGERFAQQQLDKQMGDLFESYQLLIAAGADVALVNERMADDINKYIQDSIKAGTDIPLAFKPILESLIKQGLLTDEAGNKLLNLDGLSFSETMTESVSRMVEAVMLLVAALERALSGANLLNNVNWKTVTEAPPGWNPGDPWPPPPPKAEGGWFPYRSGGYPVTVGEAGNEAIIPEEKLAGIVARAVAMAGGSNMGGGNLVVHSKVHIDGREIGKASSKAERRRQLRRHPNSSHTGRW